MPYEFYKVLHLVGVVALFVSLGALAGSPGKGDKKWGLLHGISLLVILVAGFGLLARLGLMKGMPGWAWVKLGLWLALGAMIALIRRVPFVKKWFWLIGPTFGLAAAYFAVYKPGL